MGGVLVEMFICSYLLFVVRYGWFLSRTESLTAVSSLPDLFFTLVEGTRSWEWVGGGGRRRKDRKQKGDQKEKGR